MAMRKSSRKTTKKRSTVRRRSFRSKRYPLYRNTGNIMNKGVGLPQALNCKFKYTDNFLLTGSGTTAWNFLINSLYDVDNTGSGHQPRFYDQLVASNLYNKYEVYGFKYNFEFLNLVDDGPALITVYTADLLTSGTAEECSEIKGAITKTLPLARNSFPRTIKGYANIKAIMGVSDIRDNTGLYNSSPPDPAWLQIVCDSLAGATDIKVNVRLSFIFYAKVFELRTPQQS